MTDEQIERRRDRREKIRKEYPTLPEGYDAFCASCGYFYTFENARKCGTTDYKSFCSGICEKEGK